MFLNPSTTACASPKKTVSHSELREILEAALSCPSGRLPVPPVIIRSRSKAAGVPNWDIRPTWRNIAQRELVERLRAEYDLEPLGAQ